MTIRIRDATISDVEGIAHAHVQGWRESYKDFLTAESLNGLSVEERVGMWRHAFADTDPRAKFLVAIDTDEAVVGFIRGGRVRPAEGIPLETDSEIYAIYLLDRVKRQGIGSRLMKDALGHLANHGFAAAGLWMLKDNLAARRFYESLGGVAGPEQQLELRGQTVSELSYTFDLRTRKA